MSATASLVDIDRWWRVANYLSVGQLYLLDNPLLKEPLTIEHVKPRLLGHWGTCPGINLVWAHVNRVLIARRRSAIFVCGPGHGGPAVVANPWLEGTYSELFPDVSRDRAGLTRLFRQFSFPGGIASHAAPSTPGSMHEGGELGYSLAHAYGAAFDAPGRLVVCLVGDGEAETGPLAASWHAHRFIDPTADGDVLPVLHLNGYKIANPTLLARQPERRLRQLLEGYGYEPIVVVGEDPDDVHAQMIDALDRAMDRIEEIGHDARRTGSGNDRTWPMIVLRTPKGWTGPDMIDGRQVEGHFRSHQVPVGHDVGADRLVEELDAWLRSYRPDELFDDDGTPVRALDVLRPPAELAMSSNAAANARQEPIELALPDLTSDEVSASGRVGAMGEAGTYLRDVIAANPNTFRLFGPDEVNSNRLSAVFETTDRMWTLRADETDVDLAPSGRVIEVLSEHLCVGLLEGYVLTGRHGLFTSYEAFAHIVDSMFNQHAKWLDTANDVAWRGQVPSFTYLLSSHVWRQDHNGFSHQDPGFVDVMANKKADVVRIYLPPDANTLLVVLERCLQSRQRVNAVIAGKQPEPQYLTVEEAVEHVELGADVWSWAGSEDPEGAGPDVVLACAGDVPTMEAIAASELLRESTDLQIRVVNVVDVMALQPADRHPHGMTDERYDELFPPGVATVFAFHGYPSLIHRLTYTRRNHPDLHVHGFNEEGTTTTPFDMAVRNELDRYHLAIAAVRHQGDLRRRALEPAVDAWRAQLRRHHDHVRRFGDDLDDIKNWTFVRADWNDDGE